MCNFPWCQPTRQALHRIEATLERIDNRMEQLVSEQNDIDQATTAIQGEVTDLQNQDAAIQAAQTQLVNEITSLQGQGVNTSNLVSATAALLQAQGADDSVVQALTDAANQANPPAPQPPAAS